MWTCRRRRRSSRHTPSDPDARLLLLSSVRLWKRKEKRRQAPAQDPQASPLHPHARPRDPGLRGVRLRGRDRDRGGDPEARSLATSSGSRRTGSSTRMTASACSRCCAAPRAACVVPSRDIAPVMKQAIVAIEDRRFFEHRGVDLHAIFRAVWADVTNGNVVQGGSTITQQFIKNAYVHSAPSISRKLKEAALAWQLEQKWSKDRILTAYLNTIYFGNGAYGDPAGRADLLPPQREGADAARGGAPRRDPAGPDAVRPRDEPEGGRGPARRGAARDVRAAGHHRRRAAHGASAAAPVPRATSTCRERRARPSTSSNYVKQQLVDRLRVEPGLRRRPAA